MTTVFFSYSHKDEQLRDDLEVQLTMLKREGLIEAWHDRRIAAGSDLDNAISQKLEEADVILLLASPDFLASEYCWGTGVARAMERNVSGEALVIPVILRPCEWHRAPFGKLLAVPTDGKAVTGWSDRDAAFLDVARKVRAAVEERAGSVRKPEASQISTPNLEVAATESVRRSAQVRSSNLSVTKRFTDADNDDFLIRGFEFIAEFFEASLAALNERNADITTRFRRIDSNRFTASAYRDGSKETGCTIWTGGESFGHGVNYFSDDSGATRAINGSLNIDAAEHGLFFASTVGFRGTGDGKQRLTVEQAAEHLWSKFIEPLQRR